MANNRLVASGEKIAANHPVPIDRGHPSPIRYIFYVIKENRSYDQVMGDLPQGNGRSIAGSVWPRGYSESTRAGGEFCAAGQLLYAGRPIGAGTQMVHARIRERLGVEVRQRPQRWKSDALRAERRALG